MLVKGRVNQKGDTLVEVLLATVILSIVLAGAYNLSSRATRINQQAYERTRVSNLMQEQAEYLRALRDSESAEWDTILANKLQSSAPSPTCKATLSSDIGTIRSGDAFYLSGNSTSIDINNGAYSVDGLFYIWTEAVDGGSYADFVINACWEGLGTVENNQSGMVIRLEREI